MALTGLLRVKKPRKLPRSNYHIYGARNNQMTNLEREKSKRSSVMGGRAQSCIYIPYLRIFTYVGRYGIRME